MREAHHIPVLEREVCDALAPALGSQTTRVFVDATCGLAGHSRAVLDRLQPTLAVVFDRDPQAQAIAKTRLADAPCPVHFVPEPFSTLRDALEGLGITEVAAILADLGVSSMQFDEPQRGFSFRFDAPLDMRMDPSRGESAAELIARSSVESLTKLLRDFAEETDASRIARALVQAKPTRTQELADLVEQAMSAPQRRKLGKRIHPATRTFQALRIAVNAELDELDVLLRDAPGHLQGGGRLAIITFHSLEDRRVKQRFRQLSTAAQPPAGLPVPASELPSAPFRLPDGLARGVTPAKDELDRNPRARSARLRVLERVP